MSSAPGPANGPYQTFPQRPTYAPKPSAFNRIFEEAGVEFAQITGQNIRGIDIQGLDDVMGMFSRFNEPANPEEQQRKERTKLVVKGVLTGLYVLNGLAQQVASGLFPHSNLCFNAVGWLLSVPNKINELNDGIGGLFSAIEDYLVRFKVLKTIDEMDPESVQDMIEGTAAIMKSFVRICAVCYQKWAGSKRERAKMIFKAVFADEGSKVKGELASFEKLLARQEALTGAVTLKAVVSTKKELASFKDVTEGIRQAVSAMAEQVDEIGITTKATETKVDGIGVTAKSTEFKVDELGATAKSTEYKVELTKDGVERLVKDAADKEKRSSLEKDIDELIKEMEPKNPEPKKMLDELDSNRKQILSKSLAGSKRWITALPEYQKWRDEVSSNNVLVLSGSPGCGKSYLAAQIWEDFEKDNESEARFLVAYYKLSESKDKDADKDLGTEAVIQCLKRMALQLAEKNVAYRRELLSTCKSAAGHALKEKSATIEDVWKALRLASSLAKSSYVLVLVIEDFHRLSSAVAKSFSKLLSLDSSTSEPESSDVTRMRVLVTCEKAPAENAKVRLFHEKLHICVNDHNRSDIELFIKDQLKAPMFDQLNKLMASGGDKELEKAFNEDLPVAVSGSFNNVLLKMKRLEAAVKADEDDESFSHIKKILSDKSDVDRDTVASAAIAKLNSSLNSSEIQLLNTVLQWVIYGSGSFDVYMLESIISLAGIKSSSRLQSFADKVRNSEKFGKILKIREEYGRELVEADEEVAAYLIDQDSNRTNGAAGKEASRGTVTMSITFDRARPDDMKAFFWQLHEKITTDYSVFPSAQTLDSKDGIRVNAKEAYQVIVEQSLELLTDLPDDNFESLVRWAIDNLPGHLAGVSTEDKKKGPTSTFSNRKKILRGLISLLTDVQLTARHWANCIWWAPDSWLDAEDEAVRVLDNWIHDDTTIAELKPKYSRRLKKLLDDNPGPGGFWKPLTVELGRRWLITGEDWPNHWRWIDKFLDMRERLDQATNAKEETASTPSIVKEDEEEAAPKPGIRRSRTTFSLDEAPRQQLQRSRTDLSQVAEVTQEGVSDGSDLNATTGSSEKVLEPVVVDSTDKAEDEDVDGDNKDVDPAVEQLSEAERVKRAAAFVKEELQVTEYDSTWYERLGRAYWAVDALVEASEQLRAGIEKFAHEAKLHDWLAQVYSEQKKSKLAIEHLRIVIAILEKASNRDDNVDQRIDMYTRLGELLSKAGDKDAALKVYAETLELQPTDHTMRLKYLRLQLDCGKHEDVAAFFAGAREKDGSEKDLKELSSILCGLSESNPVLLVTDMVTTVRRSQTLELVLMSVQSSIKYALDLDRVDESQVATLMTFEANLLALRTFDDDSILDVFQKWEAISNRFWESSRKGWYPHWRVECLRSSYLLRNPHIAKPSDLATELKKIGQAQVDDGRDGITAMTYLAHFYVQHGQKEKAKELFTSTMKEAFEVLSNDDTTDDYMAYTMMADVFEKTGEYDYAHAAWSLVGPNAPEPTPSLNGSDPTVTADDETASDANNEDMEKGKRTGPYWQYCDGECGHEWTFADDFVRCTVCPQTVFCRDCYGNLKTKTPHIYWCHPDHVFLDVPAWPEEDWPLGKTKVRIGGWAKPDGEVVDITEWLDRVREDWKIDMPKHYDLQSKAAKSNSQASNGEKGEDGNNDSD